MDLEKRVVLVTGANGGLGRAMVAGLLEAGAKVAAMCRAETEDLRGQLRQRGLSRDVEIFAGDVSREDDCQAAVKRTVDRFGQLDALVNNAAKGMNAVRPDYMLQTPRFWEITPAVWREMFEINVTGVFLLSQAARGQLTASQSGRIINVTTGLPTMMRTGYSPYGPSKAAVEAMTAGWAGDLAGTHVTANVLIPGGAADTPIIPVSTTPDRSGLVAPEKMVPPLLWLVSRASDGVTGRRYIATKWDASLPASEAAPQAGAAAGWQS